MAGEFTFEIVKHIGVLSETKKGWRYELNMVKWSENKPKYDLRMWSGDHKRMGKGSTFTADELARLWHLIGKIDEIKVLDTEDKAAKDKE